MTLFAIGCVVVGPMQYGLNLILILIGCHATRKNSTAEVTALLWYLGGILVYFGLKKRKVAQEVDEKVGKI